MDQDMLHIKLNIQHIKYRMLHEFAHNINESKRTKCDNLPVFYMDLGIVQSFSDAT